jgi:hypothetical protein
LQIEREGATGELAAERRLRDAADDVEGVAGDRCRGRAACLGHRRQRAPAALLEHERAAPRPPVRSVPTGDEHPPAPGGRRRVVHGRGQIREPAPAVRAR